MVLHGNKKRHNSTSNQHNCSLLRHSTISVNGTSTTIMHQYFTLWKSQCNSNYIMIIPSIRNSLPYKPKHQINPLYTFEKIKFQPHNTKLTTFNEILNHIDTTPHDTKTTTIINNPSNYNAPTLYQRISNSTDKLSFILYTPYNTLTCQWYLVQDNLKSTMNLINNYHNNNFYFCVLLDNHPSNVSESYKFSRWWQDWCEYTTFTDTGQIIYGDWFLFVTSHLPN